MTDYGDPLTRPLSPETAPPTAAPPSGAGGPYPESPPLSDPSVNSALGSLPAHAQTDSASSDSTSMKDKAADSAQAGKQAAGEVAQTATERAKDVAEETKVQARNVVGQAQDQLREQASAQQRNLVGNLRSLGDQLNSMADRCEERGQATDLVSEAGSRVHSVASWLDDREPGQLLDEVRSFARRKPGVFIAGALAAGLVAGRLTRGVVAAHQDDSGTSGTDERFDSLPSSREPGGSDTGGYRGSAELPGDPVDVGHAADPRIEVRP